MTATWSKMPSSESIQAKHTYRMLVRFSGYFPCIHTHRKVEISSRVSPGLCRLEYSISFTEKGTTGGVVSFP